MALPDLKCRNVRPSSKLQKLSDGGGLQLRCQVVAASVSVHRQAETSCPWRLPDSFSADPRQCRDEAKRLLRAGTEPSQARRQAKAAQTEIADTFRGIAEEYVSKLKQEG